MRVIPAKISVYRIEHKDSGLGPFEHGGQIPEVVNKGVNSGTSIIADIDELPEVKRILQQHPNAVFGFATYAKCISFIKNQSVLDKHGFLIKTYKVKPLFVSTDGQVLFNR